MKIGDTVHVNTDMGVPMPSKLIIVDTRLVEGKPWFALEDPNTGLQYAHFAVDELTLVDDWTRTGNEKKRATIRRNFNEATALDRLSIILLIGGIAVWDWGSQYTISLFLLSIYAFLSGKHYADVARRGVQADTEIVTKLRERNQL